MVRQPAGRQPGRRFLLRSASGSRLDGVGFRLEFKQVLYRLGDPIDRLYVPDSGVASLVSVMGDGRSAEVVTVGTEGVLHISSTSPGSKLRSRRVP